MAGEIDGWVVTFELTFFTLMGLDFAALPGGDRSRDPEDGSSIRLPSKGVTYLRTTATAAGEIADFDSNQRGVNGLFSFEMWHHLADPTQERGFVGSFGSDGDLHKALRYLSDRDWYLSAGPNPGPAFTVLEVFDEPTVEDPFRDGNVMGCTATVGLTLKGA